MHGNDMHAVIVIFKVLVTACPRGVLYVGQLKARRGRVNGQVGLCSLVAETP